MTPAGFVVDASVVVEYLVELRFTAEATKLFRKLQTLSRLVRGKAITRADGERCVDNLQRLPLSIAKSQTLIGEGYRASDAMTVYDAIYAALAERLSCELVTADAKLARVLRARSQRVLLLSDVS